MPLIYLVDKYKVYCLVCEMRNFQLWSNAPRSVLYFIKSPLNVLGGDVDRGGWPWITLSPHQGVSYTYYPREERLNLFQNLNATTRCRLWAIGSLSFYRPDDQTFDKESLQEWIEHHHRYYREEYACHRKPLGIRFLLPEAVDVAWTAGYHSA